MPVSARDRSNWRKWFATQCTDNFGQWLIGIMLALLGLVAAVSASAAGWAYSVHGELSSIRTDISNVGGTLIELKEVIGDHSHELNTVSQRVSRIEGKILKDNDGG